MTHRIIPDIATLPTVFRGIFWDAGWEFDGPCVMYSPFRRYGFGGNSYHFDRMVEDVCFDLGAGDDVAANWDDSDLREFKWRGWSPRGFSRRKQGWHIKITVEWYIDEELGPMPRFVDRKEQWGPFQKGSE